MKLPSVAQLVADCEGIVTLHAGGPGGRLTVAIQITDFKTYSVFLEMLADREDDVLAYLRERHINGGPFHTNDLR